MSKQKKIRRGSTLFAVIVGTICFLLSVSIVFGAGIFAFLYAKPYLNKTLVIIFLSAGPLPLVMATMWITLFVMETIEKIFGVSFRTKSGIEKNEY